MTARSWVRIEDLVPGDHLDHLDRHQDRTPKQKAKDQMLVAAEVAVDRRTRDQEDRNWAHSWTMLGDRSVVLEEGPCETGNQEDLLTLRPLSHRGRVT